MHFGDCWLLVAGGGMVVGRKFDGLGSMIAVPSSARAWDAVTGGKAEWKNWCLTWGLAKSQNVNRMIGQISKTPAKGLQREEMSLE